MDRPVLTSALATTPLLAMAAAGDAGLRGDPTRGLTAAGVALAFSIACLRIARPRSGPSGGPAPALAWATLSSAGLLLSLRVQVPDAGALGGCLLAAAGAFLSLLLLRAIGTLDDERAPWLWLLIAAITGLAARASMILAEPFGARSDMLPLVDSALTRFLAGEVPYGSHLLELPGRRPYALPLTYLPLQWLAYLPAHLAGVDLRWTNFGLEAGLAAAAVVWLRRAGGRLPPITRWALAAAGCAWALSGNVAGRIDAEILPFVALLVAFGAALGAERPRVAWGILALALATSPLAVVVAPYLVAHDAARRGAGRAAASALVALALALLVVLPFALADFPAFRAGVWDHWQKLFHYDAQWADAFLSPLAFSVWGYRIGRQDSLWLAQLAWCFLLFGLCLARRRDAPPAGALAFAAWTLHGFVALNVVVWNYLFLPAVAAAMVALALHAAPDAARGEAREAAEGSEWWRRPLVALSFALAAACGLAFATRVAGP